MGFRCHFVACAIIISFPALVCCGSDTWGSFIFPPNSSVTNFTAHAPTIAKVGTVHYNDDMTVEYTLPDTVESVWLSQQCYGEPSDTNSSNENSSGNEYLKSGGFESTGTLLWNLGDGASEQGTYSNASYCMFMLYDYTLRNCSWGPFGLLSWSQGGEDEEPLLISEMFKILPPNGTETATITNTASMTSQTQAPVTATQTNFTCPASGIPPTPITTPVAQMEMIPPLASGLVFPTWTYEPQEGV